MTGVQTCALPISLHTFRADIDYCHAEALTKVGLLGIKVWICRTFVSLFLWRWISHHIWLTHLILIPLSMIWIVTCVFRELEKNECNYVFGGLYLSFLNIVLSKSLRFWWLVPSFPSISFSFLFVVFILSDIWEKVKHKMRKL